MLPVEDTGWELFAVVDRGELDDPDTQLPILDGGFDQTQLSSGVQRRFGEADPEQREARREKRRQRRGRPGDAIIVDPGL